MERVCGATSSLPSFAVRLKVALQVAKAVDYLHDRRILFRDLKPANIGFDKTETLKIFDFGLARELREVDKDPDMPGMYRLSNMTGSLRYMAPEVAIMGQPYNESCDVYSFTIVLWEMLSLKRAYMAVGTTQDAFIQKVHVESDRIHGSHVRRIDILAGCAGADGGGTRYRSARRGN